jgi:hypothetical protein
MSSVSGLAMSLLPKVDSELWEQASRQSIAAAHSAESHCRHIQICLSIYQVALVTSAQEDGVINQIVADCRAID